MDFGRFRHILRQKTTGLEHPSKGFVQLPTCDPTRLASLVLHFAFQLPSDVTRIPLLITLLIGGLPMTFDLLVKLSKREFGLDLLGGISIVTSVLLGEYLAGCVPTERDS